MMRALIVLAIVALSASHTLGVTSQSIGQQPPGAAQNPAQPAQPPPPLVNTGLIVGRVIDPATGDGVAGALVMISGGPVSAPVRVQPGAARPAAPAAPPRYLTDGEGRFAFRHLTRGSYVISATKPGYADGAHGRLRPNGPTRPVQLDDGERVGEVLIRLFKFGAISGSVLDESGEPVVGVSIRAYRRVLTAGRRVFTPFGGNVVTDDRGMYRLANLAPGEYAVSVPMVSTTLPNGFTPDSRSSPNFELTMFVPGGGSYAFGGGGRQVTPDGRFLLQTGNPNASTAGAIEADGRLRTSPTIFYPGGRTISQAQIISIGSGEERGGTDIVLPLVPAANVSGQLVSPEGPAAGYAVHLVTAEADELAVDPPVASAVTASDGTFMFLAVPAGQYRLQTTRVPRPSPPPPPPPPPPPASGGRMTIETLTRLPAPAPATLSGPMLWASMPLAVGESDIDGLMVLLQEGLTVSGRAQFDGSAERPQPARLAQVPVILEPADGKQRANATMPGRLQNDGRFTSGGVLPGKYFLRIGGAPPGWTFRSAMLNGVDVSDVPFSLEKDTTGIIVTFTDRPTELRGRVSVPSGQPTDAAAVIFPADTDAWKEFGINSRRMRMARPGSAGEFSFGSPPPGDYFTVAFREEFAVEWQDPKFLEQLARVASRISVNEGERKSVDVPFHDVRPSGGDAPIAAAQPSQPAVVVSADTTAPPAGSGPFVPDGSEPQVRDRGADPRGTGSISGVVVLDGTSAPVRRARVMLISNEIRTQRSTITDDSGRFVIGWLPASRYTLMVNKPAYLTSYYGARRIGRGPGTPIEVAAGQKVAGITVPMQRGGVVTGTVFDAYGQPYANARVRLMQYVTRDGERVLQQMGSAGTGVTDDRGTYRLYGIQAGSFVVSVAAPAVNTSTETRQLSSEEMNAALSDLRQSSVPLLGESGTQAGTPGRVIPPAPAAPLPQTPAAGRPLGYAAFYYPGTPMEHEANAVTVSPGQEVSGIDIPMRLVPTARVEGVLLTPDGQPAPRASMSLISSSGGSTTSSSMRMFPDGRFQAFGVPPGRYTLTARMTETPATPRPAPVPGAPPPPPVAMSSTEAPRLTYWAQQEIDVNGEDVKDISMTLAEGMTISGRVLFEAKTEKIPTEAGRVRVSLEVTSVNRLGFTARPATIDKDGNFTITGVTPGRYRLTASVSGVPGSPEPAVTVPTGPPAPRWMVKSSVVNGLNTIDAPVEIRGGEHVTGAVVTLTDQVTELSGTIVDAANKPVPDLTVVVFSSDRAFWTSTSRRVRAPYRSMDGKFRMTALPAGEYYLAVVTEVDPAEWGDPAYMEQLAAAAIKITIAEGEKKVQDVRIGG